MVCDSYSYSHRQVPEGSIAGLLASCARLSLLIARSPHSAKAKQCAIPLRGDWMQGIVVEDFMRLALKSFEMVFTRFLRYLFDWAKSTARTTERFIC